jgi:hypothetical protein
LAVLSESVTIRVSPEEKDRLKTDALVAGLSVSELIRRRYFNMPIRAHTDILTIKELRRLGGLLKHNFTLMREVNAPRDIFEKQERLLSVIRNMINKLGAGSGSRKSRER